ncbi:MAG TPA: FHA domain-containing protein [Pyrinomonadaceae bacterium]|nr:FHA domain-containing protein [Pyrinomonadaceae bacterium]
MDSDSTMWVIVGVVVLLLFFVVLIIGVGLAIFFISRKRRKAQLAAASPGAPAFDVATSPAPEIAQPDPMAAAPAFEPAPPAFESAPPAFEPPAPSPDPGAVQASSDLQPAPDSGSLDFDPSRTVAITREKTVTISYGIIKFTSGVLTGEEFEVKPEGAYIGREPSLAQIVVADPRISKRHLWIGVRDGQVKIVDQDSRNGTFINDPRSDRVTEAALNSGDTVILGESDVARFEYQM